MGPGLSFLGEEEISEVLDVLSSRQLSRYTRADQKLSKTYQFERELEQFLRVQHCIGMNSGTSALLAGLAAIGIRHGDEVLVPGYAFVACVAAVIYAGATPVLVEIDDSLTVDPRDVQAKLTPRSRAILAVHMLGEPCAMTAISEIAKENNLVIIEDVAQAAGGSFEGRRLGSIGSVGAFSLNVFKTMTSGDGGALATDDANVYRRAFAFHDHGYQPLRTDAVDSSGSEAILGLNFRMNELAGAIALAQLRKLDNILDRLRANKRMLVEALRSHVDLRFRRSNDPDGECATTVSCILPDKHLADEIAATLGTITAINSGKHYYGNMRAVVEYGLSLHNRESVRSRTHGFQPGALPRTDDILSRTINLSVGVTDSYLGTAFGINPLSTPKAIHDKAAEFAQRTRALL